MSVNFVVKKGDVGKTISGQFLNADGTAINCTGNTARKFFMRLTNATGTVKINGATFTFTDASTGTFFYTFTLADLDTPGDYVGEFEVTLPGGVVVTVPTRLRENMTYLNIQVQSDLG